MTDWSQWHHAYDADTSLSRRLTVVRSRLRELFASSTPPESVLSLCSGEGRDLIPVLAELPAARRPSATLVGLDTDLAATAAQRADDAMGDGIHWEELSGSGRPDREHLSDE